MKLIFLVLLLLHSCAPGPEPTACVVPLRGYTDSAQMAEFSRLTGISLPRGSFGDWRGGEIQYQSGGKRSPSGGEMVFSYLYPLGQRQLRDMRAIPRDMMVGINPLSELPPYLEVYACPYAPYFRGGVEETESGVLRVRLDYLENQVIQVVGWWIPKSPEDRDS